MSRMPGKQLGPGPPGRTVRTRVKTKSKAGCQTCKIRRVKCDEARPACHRCVSTGRVCDGYGIWGGGGNTYSSKERRPATPQQMPMHPLHQCLLWRKSPAATPRMGPQEQMALHYFQTRTAYKLPGVFTSDFWESIVFQASFAEPAVFHAVIALGAIHRNESSIAANLNHKNGRRLVESHERLALQHYNKAIEYLMRYGKTQDRQSLRIVLVACVVFICLELLRRRFRTAGAHLQSGFKLLSELHPRRTGCDDDQLIEALTRINIQSALFGQGAEYLRATVPGYESSSAASDMPRIFQTTAVARQHLDRLIDGVSSLSAQIQPSELHHHPIPETFIQQKEQLQTSLARWLHTYTASLPSLISHANTKTRLSLLLLRLHHTMTSIMAATSLRGTDESVFDQHTADFNNMLAEAAALFRQSAQLVRDSQAQAAPTLSFTLDMGYIPPLYYLALKCRVPRLRRRAVELLGSMPHREGVWDGLVAAYVAGRVVEMEENGEGGEESRGGSSLPTGNKRINRVSVLLPNGAGEEATLVCERWTGGGWESWTRGFDVGFCQASLGVC